jgi:hypothetical protein
MEPGDHAGADPTSAGRPGGPAAGVAEDFPVRWLDRVFLGRRILSDLQRDSVLILTSQVEILTRLKELKKMTVVMAPDPDRAAGLAELWRLRDQFSVTDPELAAQLHAIYNQLVIGEVRSPDA